MSRSSSRDSSPLTAISDNHHSDRHSGPAADSQVSVIYSFCIQFRSVCKYHGHSFVLLIHSLHCSFNVAIHLFTLVHNGWFFVISFLHLLARICKRLQVIVSCCCVILCLCKCVCAHVCVCVNVQVKYGCCLPYAKSVRVCTCMEDDRLQQSWTSQPTRSRRVDDLIERSPLLGRKSL